MKLVKTIVIVVLIALVAGGLLFGTNLKSYMHTSVTHIQDIAKDSVSIEFELERARDLLENIIPEMHANIKLISQEEVEIAALRADIDNSVKPLETEKIQIQKMTDAMETPLPVLTVNNNKYNRENLKVELVRRFERFKEAQLVLESKKRLLTTRESALQTALDALEKTRSQKLLLQDKIDALESQYRLVKANSTNSKVDFDNSKIAQTEKLIGQIKKRLDVAERVLAHESRFIEPVIYDDEPISDNELVEQISNYFAPEQPSEDRTPSEENALACQQTVQ